MDTEDTLIELPYGEEPTNAIEKPKRKASEKQLQALALARAKRVTKKTALEIGKPTIGRVVHLPEPVAVAEPEPAPIILKKPKLKRATPKPTIIQFESDDSSSSGSDGEAPAPTIIIRNGGKKKVSAPVKQPEILLPEPPRQYIRRAY